MWYTIRLLGSLIWNFCGHKYGIVLYVPTIRKRSSNRGRKAGKAAVITASPYKTELEAKSTSLAPNTPCVDKVSVLWLMVPFGVHRIWIWSLHLRLLSINFLNNSVLLKKIYFWILCSVLLVFHICDPFLQMEKME